MATWVIEGVLAASPRPGFRPGPEFSVSIELVEAWLARVNRLGIASIMCLLDVDQLPLYSEALPGGLIAYYREKGFRVAHIPTYDGLTSPFTPAQYDAAWSAFVELPKPVLVHCSAGMDRTGRIVEHILFRLNGNGAGP